MMIIDRFEGNIAIIECDEGIFDISKDLLPDNAAEGDVIISSDNIYYVDEEETENRRKLLAERLRSMTGGAE
ncbi:MAG: DUF3006 domain-containing protein [Ruminococcus sp.]|nr:DUF3006 domain-containing protein [Ruminococcus sp.]